MIYPNPSGYSNPTFEAGSKRLRQVRIVYMM